MTCMQCVTIMGPCRVDITQVTEQDIINNQCQMTYVCCFIGTLKDIYKLLCYVLQLTVRTPLMDSGIALMIAMFSLYLKMKYASKLATSCFIKDVPQFHPGLPIVLWEVIFIHIVLYNLLHMFNCSLWNILYVFNCCLFGALGSTSSSLCEHWISRLMGSRPPSQASSGSSRRTSLASLSESAEFAGERSEDDGESLIQIHTISNDVSVFSASTVTNMNIFIKESVIELRLSVMQAYRAGHR